jgi:hypothetical protein
VFCSAQRKASRKSIRPVEAITSRVAIAITASPICQNSGKRPRFSIILNIHSLACRFGSMNSNPNPYPELCRALEQADPGGWSLFNALTPDEYLKKAEKFLNEKPLIAHYTSAEAALSILDEEQIWLRNVRFMNDYSEIQFGTEAIAEYYNSDAAKEFWKSLSRLSPELKDEVQGHYNSHHEGFFKNTYLTCTVEQPNVSDQGEIGMLSMWRGYAPRDGVALLVQGGSIFGESPDLAVKMLPCLYSAPNQRRVLLECFSQKVIRYIAGNPDVEPNTLSSYLLQSLVILVMGLKHQGFHEEREWRIVSTPAFGVDNQTDEQVKVIRGIPQKIRVLQLKDDGGGSIRLSPRSILRRIVIGPSDHAEALRDLFVELIERNFGFTQASSIVYISDIPIRPMR